MLRSDDMREDGGVDADLAAWSAHVRLHDASPGDVVQAAERALRGRLHACAGEGGPTQAQSSVDTTT